MTVLTLDHRLNKAAIKKALETENINTLSLHPSLTPAFLVRLIEEMRSSKHSRVFFELLAASPIRDKEVWQAILRAPVDANIAMTALDNPALPQESIAQLQSHSSPHVRGHALLAHLRDRLPRLSEAELDALIDEHAGDTGVSLGVRHLVACSPGVPQRILERLAEDEADFVAESAKRSLER